MFGFPLPWVLSGLAVLGMGVYLSAAFLLTGSPGFPLDDSWIHQTLARSLVREGRLAVNPGEATAASTSPLWTLLLTPGHVLGLAPFWWSHLVGGFLLVATAISAAKLSTILFPDDAHLAPLVAILVVMEWRLVWAAVSGMETLLFAFLSLILLLQAAGGIRSSWRLGLYGGLATLARPEGAVLFLLALTAAIAVSARTIDLRDPGTIGRPTRSRAAAFADIAAAIAIAGLMLLPYLVYNHSISGSPLPAAFHAKGAFYQQMLTPQVVLGYLGGTFLFFASGPPLLLIPGALFLLANLVRDPASPVDRLIRLLPMLWLLAVVGLYLVRLPVLYHHGRYLMPLLPVAFVYGVAGTAALLRALPFRVVERAAPVILAGLVLVSLGYGAAIYGWDTRIITDQHVRVAHWLRKETPPGSVVATHDIGAIGYFSERSVVDVAGLVRPLRGNPRDETQMLRLLEDSQARFAAIFPTWYPRLAVDQRAQEVFHATSDYALPADGDEFRVFLLNW